MAVNVISDRSLRNKQIKRRKRKKKERIRNRIDLSNSPEKEPFLLDTDK